MSAADADNSGSTTRGTLRTRANRVRLSKAVRAVPCRQHQVEHSISLEGKTMCQIMMPAHGKRPRTQSGHTQMSHEDGRRNQLGRLVGGKSWRRQLTMRREKKTNMQVRCTSVTVFGCRMTTKEAWVARAKAKGQGQRQTAAADGCDPK